MRVIQISDTHLSPVKADFVDNWAPLARWIASHRPDLVVHTGDVTFDGAENDDELAYASNLIAVSGRRWRVLPGNHDVGESGDHARLQRWRARFGADWWLEDIPGWRLVGLDALILGSGSADEAKRMAWLNETMLGAGARQVAWLLHKPLFLDDPGEGDTGYWSIKPQARAGLFAHLERRSIALVASGHLHKARDFRYGETRYLWGPASSFLIGDVQPTMPGEKRLGAVLYEFDKRGVAAEICDVPGLVEHWLGE
jgi:3',5'-cyclic AMP phosphodiesterase CpdA